ncbi:hypothetical protein E0H70_08150 [Rhizobium leguminosarum bv. viciae]|nr:hypothetical protein E0H70_08150 [Rhizobium leguminosarum bv. viciae]
MRFIFIAALGLVLVGCNNTTSSGQWREVQPTTKESRFERAKAVCNGRAGETQVMAGRYWIAGAIASSSTFKACMAEQGFVQ